MSRRANRGGRAPGRRGRGNKGVQSTDIDFGVREGDTCCHGLRDDILTEPLRFENGKLRVPMGPGLGVQVDESRVQRYRIG